MIAHVVRTCVVVVRRCRKWRGSTAASMQRHKAVTPDGSANNRPKFVPRYQDWKRDDESDSNPNGPAKLFEDYQFFGRFQEWINLFAAVKVGRPLGKGEGAPKSRDYAIFVCGLLGTLTYGPLLLLLSNSAEHGRNDAIFYTLSYSIYSAYFWYLYPWRVITHPENLAY